MNNVSISTEIREVCRSLHVSIAELARRTGQSPQNLNAKLNRESFTINELDSIAIALGIKFERRFVIPKGYNR
ncbi:MAG: helix-turn-helix transcriptional regulator [Sphaerochaetaceae bacterium]|nr:helix-turn-helix transcriptional regulator [Sphaerochaetaceae bacterium]